MRVIVKCVNCIGGRIYQDIELACINCGWRDIKREYRVRRDGTVAKIRE